MKVKNAFILAYNPYNAGMFSVDLAARRLATEMNDLAKSDFFVSHKNGILRDKFYAGMSLKSLNSSDQLSGYDNIIYWGDFLNHPMYGRRDFYHLDSQILGIKSEKDSFQRWKEMYLLKGFRKGSAQRIFSIGSNFLGLSRELEESRLKAEVSSLLKLFDCILPRDSGSFQEITELLPNYKFSNYGIDCAFMMNSGRAPSNSSSEFFIWHFGRSQKNRSIRLIQELSEITGLKAISLSEWLTLRPLNFRPFPATRHQLYKRYLDLMGGASFVLTDIYHLSINAFREGAKVVSLGISEIQTNALSDLKKKILFSDIGMPEWYLEVDSAMSHADVRDSILNGLAKKDNHFHAHAITMRRSELIYKDVKRMLVDCR